MVRKDMPPIRIPSAKSGDQPATREMLYIVRDELKSEIRSHSAKTDSLGSKVDSLDSRIDSLELKIDSISSKIDSRFDDIKADFHYLKLLSENDEANRRQIRAYRESESTRLTGS